MSWSWILWSFEDWKSLLFLFLGFPLNSWRGCPIKTHYLVMWLSHSSISVLASQKFVSFYGIFLEKSYQNMDFTEKFLYTSRITFYIKQTNARFFLIDICLKHFLCIKKSEASATFLKTYRISDNRFINQKHESILTSFQNIGYPQ